MGRLGMIAGLALLTFVGGCVQSGQPTSTTISPTTTTSEAISTTASTAPEPEIGEIDATGENLPAGVYTRSGFEPPIRLELDGSWQAVQVANGFFDVQKLVGTPDVIAVQFANVTEAMGADGVTEPVSAADAVATDVEAPQVRKSFAEIRCPVNRVSSAFTSAEVIALDPVSDS